MSVWGQLLNLLFPQRCVMCSGITTSSTAYCGCDLPFSGKLICPLCGKETKFCYCEKWFVSVAAPFLYEGNVKKAIIRLKHNPDKQISSFFAVYMTEIFDRLYGGCNIDLIVPVPISKTTLKSKGFNHSELLAKKISKNLNIPMCTDIVLRKNNSIPQHKLSKLERILNADQSFYLNPETKMNATSILLVDDVSTTGSTLNACSKILLGAGAKSVYCLTVAQTQNNHNRM